MISPCPSKSTLLPLHPALWTTSFLLGFPAGFSYTSGSLEGGGRERLGYFSPELASSWAGLAMAACFLKVTAPVGWVLPVATALAV